MLTLIESGSVEPVSLADAKKHIRMDDISEDDTLILSMIEEARFRAERFLNRDVVTKTYDYRLHEFPEGAIDLPQTPVKSVTSITYIDSAGASQTLASSAYSLFASATAAEIHLNHGQQWPSVRDQSYAVTIRFVTGYTDVPAPIRSAIRMMLAELYNNRANSISTGAVPKEVPMSARYLMAPYRKVAV